jgi:hypothetical protein
MKSLLIFKGGRRASTRLTTPPPVRHPRPRPLSPPLSPAIPALYPDRHPAIPRPRRRWLSSSPRVRHLLLAPHAMIWGDLLLAPHAARPPPHPRPACCYLGRSPPRLTCGASATASSPRMLRSGRSPRPTCGASAVLGRLSHHRWKVHLHVVDGRPRR